jgi:hypothetical protein
VERERLVGERPEVDGRADGIDLLLIAGDLRYSGFGLRWG